MKSIFLKIIKIKQSLQNAFPRKLKQYRDIFANEMCLKIFTRGAPTKLQKKKKKKKKNRNHRFERLFTKII